MRWRFLSTLVLLAACAGTVHAQAPVGPVKPNLSEASGTVEKYLQQFEQALKEKKPDAVWRVLDGEGKQTLLKTLEELKGETDRVAAMPVGPVIPKTPPPKPVTGPAQPPTKKDLDSELKELRESLKKANEKNPNLNLSPEADRQMKELLERLAKGKIT